MSVFLLTVFFPSPGDRPALPILKQQFSISELIASRGDGQNHTVGSEETGLQDHADENCLYCVGAIVLGYPTQPQVNSTHPRTGEPTHTHMRTFMSKQCKLRSWQMMFFSSRLHWLPIVGRAERPSSGGDASVQVLWGVRLQRCCRVTRLNLQHAHTWWRCLG